MYKTILLDGEVCHFSSDTLPLLIHGADKSGASLFTISLVADLYKQGEKVLFLSGYHMARDEFLLQTNQPQESILIEQPEMLVGATAKRVVFIPADKKDIFIRAANELPDINERIILIKNIDLFDNSVFEAAKDKSKLIVSGDLDQCSFKDQIVGWKLKSKILFSPTIFDKTIQIVPLAKYQGYYLSEKTQGVVSLG